MLGILSQWIFPKRQFPKWQLPKGIFPSGNFSNVQFLKRQHPKSILAAAPAPLAHPSCSARPHCSLGRLRAPNLTLGKMPLEKYLKPFINQCFLTNH